MSGMKDEIGEKARKAITSDPHWLPSRILVPISDALDDRDRLRQRVAELEARIAAALAAIEEDAGGLNIAPVSRGVEILENHHI